MDYGVAIRIGETLSSIWQSMSVIVFWSNGDHTVLIGGEIKPDTEIEVLENNLLGDPIMDEP